MSNDVLPKRIVYILLLGSVLVGASIVLVYLAVSKTVERSTIVVENTEREDLSEGTQKVDQQAEQTGEEISERQEVSIKARDNFKVFKSDKYGVSFKYPAWASIYAPRSYKQSEIPLIPLESPIKSYWRIKLTGTNVNNLLTGHMFIVDFIDSWSLSGDNENIFYSNVVDAWAKIPASYEAELRILTGQIKKPAADDVNDIENPNYVLEVIKVSGVFNKPVEFEERFEMSGRYGSVYLFTGGCNLDYFTSRDVEVVVFGKVRRWYSENLASDPEAIVELPEGNILYCNSKKVRISSATYNGFIRFDLYSNGRNYAILIHNMPRERALVMIVPQLPNNGTGRQWEDFIRIVKDTFEANH